MSDHATNGPTNEIPYGYCHCGCGQKTAIHKKSDVRHGYIMGEPARFVRGHSTRLRHDSAEVRFWSRVDVRGAGDCWEWQGHLNGHYGSLRVNGEITAAHRFSYELHYGPIEHGLHCLHRCDNPVCVNPAHLFLGTNQDNVDDKVAKDRAVYPEPRRGENNTFAKLTAQEVIAIRDLRKAGMKFREIAQLYGVTRGAIQSVVSKKNWKHIP